MNALRDSIDAIKVDIQNLKNNTSMEKAMVMLEKNHESLNQNMLFLKEQLENCIQKSAFEELENTLYSIHSEHKIIQKKVQTIEEMFVNSR